MDWHALGRILEMFVSFAGAALIMILFIWVFNRIEENLK
jgi:flagellar biogenesis protein FliO